MTAATLGASVLIAGGVVVSRGGATDVVWAFRDLKTRARQPDQWNALRRAKALETADVTRDADQALQKGDYRLVAIRGETGCHVPGLQAFAVCDSGVRVIADASFDVVSGEQQRLEAAAYTYAQRYNRLLLSRLNK